MEDLLGVLIELLVGALFEIALEVLFGEGFAFISRALPRREKEANRLGPDYAAAIFALLGTLAGGISVFLFPHPLFHRTRLHGISLILSPLATGYVLSRVGRARSSRGKDTARIESFWYGFTFALLMAVVRFLFVS